MYGWLWRHLPGGPAARTVGAVLLGLTVVALLFMVVFPWLDTRVPWADVTVGLPAPAVVGTE